MFWHVWNSALSQHLVMSLAIMCLPRANCIYFTLDKTCANRFMANRSSLPHTVESNTIHTRQSIKSRSKDLTMPAKGVEAGSVDINTSVKLKANSTRNTGGNTSGLMKNDTTESLNHRNSHATHRSNTYFSAQSQIHSQSQSPSQSQLHCCHGSTLNPRSMADCVNHRNSSGFESALEHAAQKSSKSLGAESIYSAILAASESQEQEAADVLPSYLAKSSPQTSTVEVTERKTYRSSFFRRSSLNQAPPDIHRITEYFKECVTPTKRLQIRLYIQAFKEIVKFLRALGTILSFASRDIDSKVVRIEDLLNSPDKAYYLYLDEMLKFEIDSGIINKEGVELLKTHRGKRFGTRIMYRLHQAMSFLVQFFTNVREHPHSKMHSIVNEAYKATISKNHGWLIRKTATLAFHAIPSRNTLIGRMGHIGHDISEQELMEEIKDLIEAATSVYIEMAAIFDTHSNIAIDEPKTPTFKHDHAKS